MRPLIRRPDQSRSVAAFTKAESHVRALALASNVPGLTLRGQRPPVAKTMVVWSGSCQCRVADSCAEVMSTSESAVTEKEVRDVGTVIGQKKQRTVKEVIVIAEQRNVRRRPSNSLKK